MTTTGQANKQRNREIAQNEEAKQAAGSARVSLSAIALAVIVLGALFTLGWLGLR